MSKINVYPSAVEGVYNAESASSSRMYEVKTSAPYSCTCVAFAITRNRAINKEPGLRVSCKHIDAAIAQFGVAIEPLSPEAYVSMIEEIKAIAKETA